MNHPLSDMMTNSMSKIRDMIDVNTVVGDPITTPGGVTIIPVTKVSIGYGGGGSDFAMKNMPANRDNPFGGGSSCCPTCWKRARPILPKRKPRKRRKKQPKRHKTHAPCKSLCQGDGYARFV